MNRPSEVPPVVDSSVSIPADLLDRLRDRLDQASTRRQERHAGQRPFDRVLDAVLAQDAFEALLQAGRRAGRAEAKVEQQAQLAGHDVVGTGSGVNVGHLPCRRREIFVAIVPVRRCELGQRRRGQMNRIFGQLRIRDVTLHATHDERAGQGSAPSVLDHVAEPGGGSRLADDAVVQTLAARLQRFDHAHGAVHRYAFLVGGNQESDRARVLRMRRHKPFDCRHECGDRGFHVGRTAAVEKAVTLDRLERIAVPLIERTCRNDVGMSGETNHRCGGSAPCPEIVDATETQVFDLEADACEPICEHVLAAAIVRRHRAPGDQLTRELQGGGMLGDGDSGSLAFTARATNAARAGPGRSRDYTAGPLAGRPRCASAAGPRTG